MRKIIEKDEKVQRMYKKAFAFKGIAPLGAVFFSYFVRIAAFVRESKNKSMKALSQLFILLRACLPLWGKQASGLVHLKALGRLFVLLRACLSFSGKQTTGLVHLKALGRLIILLSVCLPAWGKQITGLYDAKALVADQQAQSRLAGAQQGLLEVLQKVSGFPVSAENPVVARSLKIADQYLYQFSYAHVEKSEAIEGQSQLKGDWLNMRFEGKAIQRMVKQANLPRWGTNRPTMLVWLAIDDGERKIISDGLDHVVHEAILDGAQRRGIPIILPIYDLEDSIKLPMEQLWGMFSEGVLSASERYGAESILMARVVKTDEGQWTGRWRFHFRDKEYDYEFIEETLDALVLSGLSAGSQVLANAFALKTNGLSANELRLDILNVSNLNHYAAVVKYLEKLAITKQVAVVGVKKQQVSFDLSLNGSFEQLEQTLALDKKLVRKALPKTDENEDPDMAQALEGPVQFLWQP